MNIADNKPLLEHLASSYALGTLRGAARRRFETIARESATVRVAARIWQERFSSITELQVTEQPGPNVWKRIENGLRTGQQLASSELTDTGLEARLRRILGWWRSATLAGGLATAALVLVSVNLNRALERQGDQMVQTAQQNLQLVAQLKMTPRVQYVAVLADAKSVPSMLVTVDVNNQRLILKRLGDFQEAADKSLQLWALPPTGAPQSLGVLGGDKLVRLAAAEGQIHAIPALAISLEPKGGVPSERGPTGPVLFHGALLQTTL